MKKIAIIILGILLYGSFFIGTVNAEDIVIGEKYEVVGETLLTWTPEKMAVTREVLINDDREAFDKLREAEEAYLMKEGIQFYIVDFHTFKGVKMYKARMVGETFYVYLSPTGLEKVE